MRIVVMLIVNTGLKKICCFFLYYYHQLAAICGLKEAPALLLKFIGVPNG